MGFAGNYAPHGLSPQTDGMPVILEKAGEKITCPFQMSLGSAAEEAAAVISAAAAAEDENEPD